MENTDLQTRILKRAKELGMNPSRLSPSQYRMLSIEIRSMSELIRDGVKLASSLTRQAIGVKTVTVMPGAAALGAGTVQASYLLLDRDTGVPLALLDGEALTLRRTAATSALAARARPVSYTHLTLPTNREV